MAHVTIPQALQYVADHPLPSSDVPLEVPVWELVARMLFDIAQKPDAKVRGGLAQATRAQKMILDRLAGTRRPGSKPASHKSEGIDYIDLTTAVISV